MICPRCGGTSFSEFECGDDSFDSFKSLGYRCDRCELWYEDALDRWFVDIGVCEDLVFAVEYDSGLVAQ